MVFININPKNYGVRDSSGKTKVDQLNELIATPNSKVFILFYMEGCGPCNSTRPEWGKLKNVFKNLKNNTQIGIVDIDQILSSKIKHVSSPSGFPTMKYITNKGKTAENYEDSNVEKKDRSIDSFAQWIKSKIGSSPLNHKNTHTRKNKRGGRKWSLKYKKTINCRRPKGFSQRQYCKYGRG